MIILVVSRRSGATSTIQYKNNKRVSEMTVYKKNPDWTVPVIFAESVQLDSSWDGIRSEFSKPYFKNLELLLDKELGVYGNDLGIFPPKSLIFNSFLLCPLNKLKVIILGQDPYHGYGQAMGLSFSVPRGVKIPPSLLNIYKELSTDPNINFVWPEHGDLTKWTEQGILLLNTTLTVREYKAASHTSFGWTKFTDYIIKYISQQKTNLVFILLGGHAQQKKKLINNKKHHILETSHPSPLSAHRGFLGSGIFSTCNNILIKLNYDPIDWNLD